MLLNTDTVDFHTIKGIPVESLYSHVLVTGTTGAGKTRAVLRPLLRSLLSLRAGDSDKKAGALIIDPKGDLLPVIQNTLEQCGRHKDLVLIGPGQNEYPWNPLDTQVSPAHITAMILAACGTLGQNSVNRTTAGDRFWETQDRALLRALVAVTRHAVEVEGSSACLTLEDLQKCRSLLAQPEQNLQAWAAELVAEIGLAEGMSLLEIANLPATTRNCVIGSVGALLQPFACDPLRAVLQPDSHRPPIDLRTIFEAGKIVVINVTHVENALELLPAQVMIKSAFTRLALSRSRWAKNAARPCWLVIDEAARCFTAHADSDSNETNLMDMARSNRVGVIWCAQNLSALLAMGNEHLVHKLTSLAGTHIFLANTCPAVASLVTRSLGVERGHEFHQSLEESFPPPRLFPRYRANRSQKHSGVLVPTETPRVSAAALARLRPGEMWLRLAHSGRVHHLQADVSAP